jgi:hypothetical protein
MIIFLRICSLLNFDLDVLQANFQNLKIYLIIFKKKRLNNPMNSIIKHTNNFKNKITIYKIIDQV